MTKLYEVETILNWQNLNTLTGVTLSGEYELWNAGREHDVVNIFYTESAEEPTDDSFYKALPRQNKAIIEVGEQPIWIKSEVKTAKLIISTSIEGEVSENIADIEGIATEIAVSTDILADTVSDGKILVTETSASAIAADIADIKANTDNVLSSLQTFDKKFRNDLVVNDSGTKTITLDEEVNGIFIINYLNTSQDLTFTIGESVTDESIPVKTGMAYPYEFAASFTKVNITSSGAYCIVPFE